MINNGENKVVNFPDTLNETDLSPTVRQAVGLSRIPSERIGHTVVPYHQTAMLIGGEVRKQFWFQSRKEISVLSIFKYFEYFLSCKSFYRRGMTKISKYRIFLQEVKLCNHADFFERSKLISEFEYFNQWINLGHSKLMKPESDSELIFYRILINVVHFP